MSRLAVAGELDADQYPQPAHVADDRELGLELAQAADQLLAAPGRVRDQVLFFDRRQSRCAGCARHRIPAVGAAVRAGLPFRRQYTGG